MTSHHRSPLYLSLGLVAALGLVHACGNASATASPAQVVATTDGEVAASEPVKTPAATPQPWLCDLEGGRWCHGCGTGPCPQGKSGWLCCIGDICVAIKVASDCTTGVWGWCNNYTETTSPAGNTTATCHD